MTFFEISFRISEFWKVLGLKNMKVTYVVWHIIFNIFLPLKSFSGVKNRKKWFFFEISFRISEFWKVLGQKNMKVTYMVWHIIFNIFLPLKSFRGVKNRKKMIFFEISFRILEGSWTEKYESDIYGVTYHFIYKFYH